MHNKTLFFRNKLPLLMAVSTVLASVLPATANFPDPESIYDNSYDPYFEFPPPYNPPFGGDEEGRYTQRGRRERLAVEEGTFEVMSTSPRGQHFTNKYSSTKTFRFFATGGWTYNPAVGYHGAEGYPKSATSNYMLPGCSEGALIVRKGNNNYQCIGTEATLRLRAQETVYFLINDAKDRGGYTDNQGSITVEWFCQDCRTRSEW
jgi:hypothetical protein